MMVSNFSNGVNYQENSENHLNYFYPFINYIILNQEMPRKQSLAEITPNRYYHLQATLKYIHETETITTAIIEQDNIQKRIKLPHMTTELQEGAQYCFEKCFYSKNGWIRVDQTDKVKLLEARPNEFLTLQEIYDSRAELSNHYVTTILQIVEIGSPEKKLKDGQQLTLTKVKAFADNLLIDLTFWNRELSKELIGKAVIIQGVRVKLLTHSSIVLVSTVYTKIHQIEGEIQHKYDPKLSYKSLSQVYINRTIAELNNDIYANEKSFSIITAKIEEILIFDYEGCSKCRKKIEVGSCLTCGEGVPKGQFWVAQLLVQDETAEMVLFVFDEKILGAFRLARKGTVLSGRVKSTYRVVGEEKTVSNVLTRITSIQF